MNIGLFGGTFDPFHTDHRRIIEYSLKQLNFDEIWIILNYQNPFKTNQKITSLNHRLAMVQLGIIGLKKVAVKNFEFSAYVHNTYDTVRNIKRLYPDYTFSFILGADNLDTLHQWHNIQELKKLIDFIVFCRCPKQLIHSHQEKSQTLILSSKEKLILKMEYFNSLNLASNEIRSGFKLKYQLPLINQYINENNLYLEPRLIASGGVKTKKRFLHCAQVAVKAQELALDYNVNARHAYQAGYYHDITKHWTESQHIDFIKRLSSCAHTYLQENPKTYHAISGYLYLKHQLLIKNNAILNSVKYHTIGAKKTMTKFAKIIYVADKISHDRNYDNVDFYRNLATANIDLCYWKILENQYKTHHNTLVATSQVWSIYEYWKNIFNHNND